MSDDAQQDDEPLLSAEMMDRDERKALKKKEKEEEEAKKVKKTPEEIEAALARSKFAEAKKKKKKKLFKYGLIAGALCVVSFLGYGFFRPYTAGQTYGICRTFLELNVQFPQEVRVSLIYDLGMTMRILYTQLDAFGQYRMETIECIFRPDDVTGAALERVSVDRREVDQKKVEAFNKTIPIILANPPDLTIPAPLPDSLEGLQFQTDNFRFQLNLEGF